METHFSTEQLAQPDLATAANVIDKCIHCGFCNATCPTYLISQDEADGPRGRIGIMQSLLETDRDPTPAELQSLDRCLTCLSCHSTCAADVDYLHLLGVTRHRLEGRKLRPWHQSLLRKILAHTLPDPKRFAFGMVLARLARPFASLLPSPLSGLIDMARPHDIKSGPVRPGLYRPLGETRSRVLLMAGCVQNQLDSEIDHATIRLLNRFGVEVLVPAAQGCCGALGDHLGHRDPALAHAAAMMQSWQQAISGFPVDAIIVNASGCGFHIRDWGFQFKDDPHWAETAAQYSTLVQDVAKFAGGLGMKVEVPPLELKEWPVALHIPCSQVHGMGIYMEPKSALEAVGFTATFVEDLHICCGAAGTYSLFQPEVAQTLKTEKLAKLIQTQGKVIASGNMGCNAHLRTDSPLPVVHVVQLLDWATGGPKPDALTTAV